MREMIIDGDGHYLEPSGIWKEYIEPRHRDQVHVDLDTNGFTWRVFIGSHKLYTFDEYASTGRPWGPGDMFVPGGVKRDRATGRGFEEAEPGGWSAARRLQVHDQNDIDAAVLFPTFGMLTGFNPDPELAAAACTAVNHWAADYASAAPKELYIVAALPWQDPPRAAAELRRAVTEHRFVAGMVSPYPAADGRTLAHPSLDVLWATAVELDVPICVHSAARTDLDQLGSRRASTYLLRHAAVHTLESMIGFGNMFEGQVFDRFPTLRAGFMESSCGWAPFWVERLEEHAELFEWMFEPPLRRMPSQVFAEQCIVGCEGEESMVPYVQQRLGLRSVIWASDFPHFDVEPPYAEDMLRRTDLTPEQLRAVMCDASVAFYGLDVEAIRDSHRRRGAATAVATAE
jgi:uncharacterized protein